MKIINNMNLSRELSDIEFIFDQNGYSDLEFLLKDFHEGQTNWSVPKKASPGDVVVFMCAKSARNNLGLATSHLPDYVSQAFRDFVDREKLLYKKYSGHLLGYGFVASSPEYDAASNRWYADINQLCEFPNPIFISEFRSFITVSSTNSITYLKDEQWDRLRWVVNQQNPGLFSGVIAPEAEVLNQEFEKATQKEAAKPIDKLKKAAQKMASKPAANTVTTTVYQRNPTIAAYAKKRASGKCQLCGQPAPFLDQNGDPYLECHHIEWLSKGGLDAVDNCAALCPNCHRKMHIINDPKDIAILKYKVTKQ